MRSSFALAPVALLVVAVACSSSGSGGASGSLDCDTLAGSNCWKSTVSSAESCLPPTTESGTLSADGKTCTYASGAVVTFDTPLTLPLNSSGGMLWSFTVNVNGALCLKFAQSDKQHQAVTTSAGTVSIGTVGSSYVLACPNGTSLANSNPLSLLSCDGGLTTLPGYEDSSSGSSVTFSVLGTGARTADAGGFGGGVQVFSCHM